MSGTVRKSLSLEGVQYNVVEDDDENPIYVDTCLDRCEIGNLPSLCVRIDGKRPCEIFKDTVRNDHTYLKVAPRSVATKKLPAISVYTDQGRARPRNIIQESTMKQNVWAIKAFIYLNKLQSHVYEKRWKIDKAVSKMLWQSIRELINVGTSEAEKDKTLREWLLNIENNGGHNE